MKQPICFLFGAGDYNNTMPILPDRDDYVIAVDGGLDYLLKTNIAPDIIIGDFDSVSSSHIEDLGLSTNITNKKYETISFPPEKDYTDMNLAVKEGIKRGFNTFIIYGGLGGRIDHSIANIQLIAWLSSQKLQGFLIGGRQVITSITNSTFCVSCDSSDTVNGSYANSNNICTNCYDSHTDSKRIHDLFSPIPGRYISIFSHSNISEGVTIKGLKYETDNTTLTNTFALGTSNSFTGSNYSIEVQNGTLIIVSELV